MTYNLHVDIRKFEGPYRQKTLSCLRLVISYFKVCPFYFNFFFFKVSIFLHKKNRKKYLLLNYYMF